MELFADKEGREDTSFLKVKNSNFKKGNDALKQALSYRNKNKIEKSNKRAEKALGYFILANEETPDNTEILNLLGLSYYLIGDTIMSEIYYQEGLNIEPQNNSLNQGLGELYFVTKRIDQAKKILKVLKKCNCKEYHELKEIIALRKNPRY
tara:strand:+ start:229 stop:681 length:453 start_codon:yes stop_codon:yes gene_type:complete